MVGIFNTFVMLFVVIDPIGLAPIFAALTFGGSESYRRRMAMRGTMLAAVVLFVFMFVGKPLLHALGIGLPAFRIAGGALLFLLAIDMVFARQSGLRSTTEREQEEAGQRKDISVFPLAVPLIAGPGAITTVLLMSGTAGQTLMGTVAKLLVLLAVLLLALGALMLATRIMRFMGETGANTFTRTSGVILAALAVQFMIDGLTAVIIPQLK
ncbi:MAG: NAAT family transporter [Gammaproteobacteria bacterium]|nr:NAAT family transporter [Gammaproteobacteria bacterium]